MMTSTTISSISVKPELRRKAARREEKTWGMAKME
jgi:hypothetical protein